MSCGVGCRCSSDLELLWLWHKSGAAALIRPLSWEPPYATGAALKRPKKKKRTKFNKRQKKCKAHALKTTKTIFKNLSKISINENTFHVHGLENLRGQYSSF